MEKRIEKNIYRKWNSEKKMGEKAIEKREQQEGNNESE